MSAEFAVLVEQREFQRVMSRYITGVSVVTTTGPGGPLGLTVNSFTSVSLEPATVLVCLNCAGRVYHAVEASGCYAINILGGAQARLASRFAHPGLDHAERFRWLELEQAVTGCPLIIGSAAWLDCRVRDKQDVHTHGIFIADVVAAGTDPWQEAPLLYYQRSMAPMK